MATTEPYFTSKMPVAQTGLFLREGFDVQKAYEWLKDELRPGTFCFTRTSHGRAMFWCSDSNVAFEFKMRWC
jgi:hypothetical protein